MILDKENLTKSLKNILIWANLLISKLEQESENLKTPSFLDKKSQTRYFYKVDDKSIEEYSKEFDHKIIDIKFFNKMIE